MKEAIKHEKGEKVPALCSKRWILAYVAMLGICTLYILRVNMSVAIVCMVKYDNSTESSNGNNTDKCGILERDPDADPKNVYRGEFEWDKSTESIILSSFFYGYIVTQIPGGWVSGKFGAKYVFGGGILITSLATVLVPVAARFDYRLVVALRTLMGLAEGVVFPSMQDMWGKWAPGHERTRLISFTSSGVSFGNIVAFILSSMLCAEGFDNGWGSVFYVTGGIGVLWCIIWFYTVASSPDVHSTISVVERDYIKRSLAKDAVVKKYKVPWRALLSSRAMWVCLIAHSCNNWMHYTLLTGLPSFMKEVLKFDIKQNGLLSAIPYMASGIVSVFIGQIADWLRSRYLSTTVTRRLIQATSFIGAGSLIVSVGFITCTDRTLAVILLTAAVALEGMINGGYMVNYVDFAPRYAGVLFGITNCIATVPGILAPIAVGALTPNKTQEEWRNVFYVCGALTLIGAIAFGGFAQGETEPWARDPLEDPPTSGDDELDGHKNKSGAEKRGSANPAFLHPDSEAAKRDESSLVY